VTEQGDRRVLGAATGATEDHQFWTSFLRLLLKRGLKGVRLVISDANEGLRQAMAKVLHEATWQRCRVHFMRAVPNEASVSLARIGPVWRCVRSNTNEAAAEIIARLRVPPEKVSRCPVAAASPRLSAH
jgi:Transposase, Mutator family